MIITFTDQEMEQIELLALIRHHSAGIAVPPKYSKLDALGIDRLGAMGEAALSKHFTWAVSTMLFTNRDDGRDFKTDLGSVQVKTREDSRAKNFIQANKQFRANYGVLARKVEDNSIELYGWFYKQTWDKFHEVKEYDGSIRYLLSGDYMNRNINELID